MLHGTIDKVMKSSMLYSYALSQPFTIYADASPIFENNSILETEIIEHGYTDDINLKMNQYKYSLDSNVIDKKLGLLTEQAENKIQSSQQIKITKQTDINHMKTQSYNEKQEQIKQIEPTIQQLYLGLNSEEVKHVQEVLAYQGYYEGNIDGIYGPLTDQAIEKVKLAGLLQIEDETNDEATTPETLTDLGENEDENENDLINHDNLTPSSNEEEKPTEAAVDIKPIKVEPTNEHIIKEAQAHIGTPYVWGGESPQGFDCSGFVQFVYQQNDITVPRTVSDMWNFAQPVDEPSIGDLVFFETYKPGPSHMGFYIGNGNFIHAGSSRGVEISEMNNSYWQSRYLGAKRVK